MPDHDESAPAGQPAEDHLDGEAPVETGSELDECVAEAILALTKASRASLLYDADNEAVAGFLSELNDRFGQALRHGAQSSHHLNRGSGHRSPPVTR